MTTYHLCLDVKGFLTTAKKSQYRRMLKHLDGRYMTPDEVKSALLDELARGHLVIPVGECTNFDFSRGGCLGHSESTCTR
jgi:hypothetical protein